MWVGKLPWGWRLGILGCTKLDQEGSIVSFLSILLFFNYLLPSRTNVSTHVSSGLLVHSTILPISQPLLFIHIYDCAAAESVHGGLFSPAALVGHEHCQQHCEHLGPGSWQPSRDTGTVRIMQKAGKGGGVPGWGAPSPVPLNFAEAAHWMAS